LKILKKNLQNRTKYVFMYLILKHGKEGYMRISIILLIVIALALVGCTTKYTLAPEDKALLDSAIESSKDAKVSASSASSSAGKATTEADRAEAAANKAQASADSAERAANRAERAADSADKSAEKAVKAFEMKQIK
jgi:hypothetical protein